MTRSIPSIEDCKRRASLLLKALRSADPPRALEAANRFRAIERFAESVPESIVEETALVKHKHALEVIAREKEFVSWKALRDAADIVWYPKEGGSLNAWYATYAEARECREKYGGYLLTYRGKYFVCQRRHIESLGLDPADPRWDAIGHDCRMPKDRGAFEELRALANTGLDAAGV